MGCAVSLDIRATATVEPGVKTGRVASVKTRSAPKSKTGQRRIFAGRSATKIISISLGVEDLAQLDADAQAAGLSRSTYITECWRKARAK
jgi:hypothetical protein